MSAAHPPVVEAAQVVAGVVAARGRGDIDGARTLLTSIDQDELLAGSLLVAELALGLLSRSTGESLDQCAGELSLEILSVLNR